MWARFANYQREREGERGGGQLGARVRTKDRDNHTHTHTSCSLSLRELIKVEIRQIQYKYLQINKEMRDRSRHLKWRSEVYHILYEAGLGLWPVFRKGLSFRDSPTRGRENHNHVFSYPICVPYMKRMVVEIYFSLE